MVPGALQTAAPSEIRNPAVIVRERSKVVAEPVEATGAAPTDPTYSPAAVISSTSQP
jgi:hypothetical protein